MERLSELSNEAVTALTVAVLSEEKEAVALLLGNGAAPNTLNCDGTTALSQVNCHEICQSLIAHGARVAKEELQDGQTSEHHASATGQVEILANWRQAMTHSIPPASMTSPTRFPVNLKLNLPSATRLIFLVRVLSSLVSDPRTISS